MKTLIGHTGYVLSLAVLYDGSLLSGSKDKTIQIWNTTTWLSQNILRGHNGWIYSLAALSDGLLASGSTDIRIWDTKNRKLIRVLSKSSSQVSSPLTVCANGWLAGYNNRDIIIWNTTNGQQIRLIKGPASTVYSLTVLSNLRLANGNGDGTVQIWYI